MPEKKDFLVPRTTRKFYCSCLDEVENNRPRTLHCFIACEDQHVILRERAQLEKLVSTHSSDTTPLTKEQIILKQTLQLKILHENRGRAEEFKWSEGDINACEEMMQLVAGSLADLKRMIWVIV